MGGFDMDSDACQELCLRFSKEGDKFTALDAEASVDIPKGEAVYASGNTIVTRHINWRQSREGLIQQSTINACFMAEVLDGYPKEQLVEIQRDLKEHISRLFKVEATIFVLNSESPSISYQVSMEHPQ